MAHLIDDVQTHTAAALVHIGVEKSVAEADARGLVGILRGENHMHFPNAAFIARF